MEKVLMRLGGQAYAQVGKVLASHNISFSNCYQNPALLNSALRELPRETYLAAIENIGIEFAGLSDKNGRIATFLQQLRL